MKTVKLGAATGWARDRFGPAEDLVRRGNLDYLCYESMSEVTMSAAQVKKIESPDAPGYDPYLESRLKPVIRECKEKGIKIISNQGWIEPVKAAEKVLEIAKKEGIKNYKVAAVNGGILTDSIASMGLKVLETGEPLEKYKDRIVSAEAYLGAAEITEALREKVDCVITARVADACLFLGPLAYEFNWSYNDWDALGKGMVIGHLLECACQITGGYFADPGYKNVPDPDRLGHPIVEVSEDGIYITKLPDTGGVVSTETCKEQTLYEVQDPASYYCPDTIVDFTKVKFSQAAENKVKLEMNKGVGRLRPETLKVLIGVKEGYIAEEMMVFAGLGAMERAELAKDILKKRLDAVNLKAVDIRFDYLGINGVHRESSPQPKEIPYEVIVRVALKTESVEEANKLRIEIDPMAVNGPSGTGKWAPMGNRVRPVVGLYSALVPRTQVQVSNVYLEL